MYKGIPGLSPGCGNYKLASELFKDHKRKLPADHTFEVEIMSTPDGFVIHDYERQNRFLKYVENQAKKWGFYDDHRVERLQNCFARKV